MTWKSFWNSIPCFLLLLFLGNGLLAQTQDQPVDTVARVKKVKEPKPPLKWELRSLRVGTDISYPLWLLVEPDDQRGELSLEANFSNRVFGVVEAGYTRMRSVKPPNIFEYINRGYYVRIGADYNALYRMFENNAVFVGVAYGQAFFEHQITYLVGDEYWGIDDINNDGVPDYSVLIEEDGMRMSWFELNFGAKIKVWKRFYAGYRFRFQFQTGIQDGQRMKATNVPGFFKTNRSTNLGFGYHIWYDIPFKK
ncbi:MAG: DUF6048 family protein [Bacteroidota bacterium]